MRRVDRARGPAGAVGAAVLLATLAAGTAACAVMDEQLQLSAAGQCIRTQCKDPDATDYTKCEAACRAQYAK
jgi:hypothetical protein